MNTLNSVFGKILCINRDARKDRWENVERQCKKYSITLERFRAHEAADCVVNGKPNSNYACTASHRGCLELFCHHPEWGTLLVLEDDFQIVHTEFLEMFDAMWKDVPPFDQLYLGAGYGEDPQYRVNGSLIRCNRMLTTSSYAISYDFARKITPWISHVGPIDSLMGGWHREHQVFCFDPRLIEQMDSYSDLAENFSKNSNSMRDTAHVDRLDRREADCI